MVGQLYHNAWTFTSDAVRILSDLPLIFIDLDIQILSNDAYMGDVNGQNLELAANDIVSYRNAKGIDLRQFFFKNQGAGANIKVVVNGILKD